MKITNKNGRSFLVRVVRKGDRYGYDDALVHDRDDALIEFYDLKYKDKSGFGPRGQFVSRYYAETLASHPQKTGLDLHGGTPAWSLDAEAFAPVRELARELRRERFEAAIRGPKRDPRAMKTKRRKKTKSAKFERCVRSVKKSQSAANPWAVCHAALKGTRRDPGKKLRVERGPTGAAAWHLPHSKLFVYWAGPGARLRIGTRDHLTTIDHPSADGNYDTFKQANNAVKAFLRAGTTSSRSRDPGRKFRVWVFRSASSFGILEVEAANGKEAIQKAWRQYPRAYSISLEKKSSRDPRGALVNRPRHARRSIPSQHEYESRELSSFHQDLQRVEKASLADRKEGAREFARAMEHDPELVAERVGWLLAGNFGFGSYKQANEVARNTRMNRVAWLSQVAGALEWHSPFRMTAAAWKKMPKAAKDKLHVAVSRVLEAHLREGGGQ